MFRQLLNDRPTLLALGLTLAATSSIIPRYRNWIEKREADELGLTSNFHFARRFPGESFLKALARHEHYLFMQLHVRRGMRVLEIGCGTGGRARELAHFADVKVVGIDADASNIELAKICTENACLSHRVSFAQGEMEAVGCPFEDNSFDAVFCIESITSSVQFDTICNQVRRVLKPGGKFAFYRWCLSDTWDTSRMDHHQVHVQLGSAIQSHGQPLHIQSMQSTITALTQAGFSLRHSEDLARHIDEVPWHHTLEELEGGRPVAEVSWAWWNEGPIEGMAVRSLEFAVHTILKAGKLGLLTPMALFVVEKTPTAGALHATTHLCHA